MERLVRVSVFLVKKRGVSDGGANGMDADDDTGKGNAGVVEDDGGGFGSI